MDRTNERQRPPQRTVSRLGFPVWITGGVFAVLGLVALIGNLQHLRGVPGFEHPRWNGDLDGSYAELGGHVVLVVAAVLLVALALRHRSGWAYGGWAFVLTGLVVDDFFMLHERGGEYLAAALSLPVVLNLRPVDLGELLVWGAEAAVLVIPLIAAHLASSRVVRRDSWSLLALMVVLALFAVLLDMVNIAVESRVSRRSINLLVLIETAGELGVMALILLRVIQISQRPGPSTAGTGGGGGLPAARPHPA